MLLTGSSGAVMQLYRPWPKNHCCSALAQCSMIVSQKLVDLLLRSLRVRIPPQTGRLSFTKTQYCFFSFIHLNLFFTSFSLSHSLSLSLSLNLSISQSLSFSNFLSLSFSVSPILPFSLPHSIHLSIYLSIHISIYLSIHLQVLHFFCIFSRHFSAFFAVFFFSPSIFLFI